MVRAMALVFSLTAAQADFLLAKQTGHSCHVFAISSNLHPANISSRMQNVAVQTNFIHIALKNILVSVAS